MKNKRNNLTLQEPLIDDTQVSDQLFEESLRNTNIANDADLTAFKYYKAGLVSPDNLKKIRTPKNDLEKDDVEHFLEL